MLLLPLRYARNTKYTKYAAVSLLQARCKERGISTDADIRVNRELFHLVSPLDFLWIEHGPCIHRSASPNGLHISPRALTEAPG